MGSRPSSGGSGTNASASSITCNSSNNNIIEFTLRLGNGSCSSNTCASQAGPFHCDQFDCRLASSLLCPLRLLLIFAAVLLLMVVLLWQLLLLLLLCRPLVCWLRVNFILAPSVAKPCRTVRE